MFSGSSQVIVAACAVVAAQSESEKSDRKMQGANAKRPRRFTFSILHFTLKRPPPVGFVDYAHFLFSLFLLVFWFAPVAAYYTKIPRAISRGWRNFSSPVPG